MIEAEEVRRIVMMIGVFCFALGAFMAVFVELVLILVITRCEKAQRQKRGTKGQRHRGTK